MHVESAVCLVEIETHLPCLVLVDLVHCSHLIKLGEESRDRGGEGGGETNMVGAVWASGRRCGQQYAAVRNMGGVGGVESG